MKRVLLALAIVSLPALALAEEPKITDEDTDTTAISGLKIHPPEDTVATAPAKKNGPQYDAYGKVGASEGAGFLGGAGFHVSGKINNSEYPTEGTIEVLGGQPMLRIKATGEIYPIGITTQTLGAGYGHATLFKLFFDPARISSQTSIYNGAATRANVTGAPDIAAQLIYRNPAHGFTAQADAHVGFAGGYAHDANGGSAVAGPTLGAGGELRLVLAPGHALSAAIGAQYIPSVLKTMNGAYQIDANLKYTYTTADGTQLYAAPTFETERFETVPKGTSVATGSGVPSFAGLVTGVKFQ
jgi:hypothetical protein